MINVSKIGLFNPCLLAAALILASHGPGWAGSATWDGGNSGNWGDPLEWVGDTTFPNGVGETATFTNAAFFGGGGVIALADSLGGDISITIGTWSKTATSDGRSISLNNVAGGSGKLIFDSASGNATYSSNSTNANPVDTINVAIQLNDSLNVSGTIRFIRFRNTISEFGGANSITKSGASTLRLEGSSPNTFSGGFTINNGAVSAEKNGAMGSGNVAVAETSLTTTAKLTITTGVTDAIANSAVLSLQNFTDGVTTNFAMIELASGVSETVAGLSFNGIMQTAGTWGATGSGADHIDDNWFSGAGVLVVVPEPSLCVLLAFGAAGLVATRRRRC